MTYSYQMHLEKVFESGDFYGWFFLTERANLG